MARAARQLPDEHSDPLVTSASLAFCLSAASFIQDGQAMRPDLWRGLGTGTGSAGAQEEREAG